MGVRDIGRCPLCAGAAAPTAPRVPEFFAVAWVSNISGLFFDATRSSRQLATGVAMPLRLEIAACAFHGVGWKRRSPTISGGASSHGAERGEAQQRGGGPSRQFRPSEWRSATSRSRKRSIERERLDEYETPPARSRSQELPMKRRRGQSPESQPFGYKSALLGAHRSTFFRSYTK